MTYNDGLKLIYIMCFFGMFFVTIIGIISNLFIPSMIVNLLLYIIGTISNYKIEKES
jgi:hypothetical protein